MKTRRAHRGLAAIAFAFLLPAAADALAQTATAGQIVISEFRLRGPNGASDEYIVLHNRSGAAHTVTAASGSGYGLAASDGITRCTIPNGQVIPNQGAFLCANSAAYSLTGHATPDANFTDDIADNAGIALFNNNSGGATYSLANRLDAVGSTSEANTLYKEGTGYPAITPFSIDYAWTRDRCGKAGSITALGPCPLAGTVKDTDNNAADFYFVDTNGTSAGAGQRLGAPAPRSLASTPLVGSGIGVAMLDGCFWDGVVPNRVRDFTSDPANNSTFGTVEHRLTFTNNTGAQVTALRFYIIDLTTFPAPFGFADLRPRTSSSMAVTVDRPPCSSGTSNPTVQGTTLALPPSQPNGGGFNSVMFASSVSFGAPLANGASIDLRFLFGLQQTGVYKFALAVSALPSGGALYYFDCDSEGDCIRPLVQSIVRASPNPTSASSVDYTVTFTQSVTGVDASDFQLTATGTAAGTIAGVTGSGATYTVTVNGISGTGTLTLFLVDDDSIVGSVPLGGTGAGNGSFAGQPYDVAPPPPVPRSGFNGDETSDVLWRNTSTGQVYQWQMNGLAISGQGYMPDVPTNWAAVATGDANGDGNADVFWREATGLNYLWIVNGLAITSQGYLNSVPNPWIVAGMGDASGDGKSDVFWRNPTSGDNYLWIMNGLSIASQGYLPNVPGPDWEVAGVADYSGDGKADVLWRNKATGQNYLWIMNGLAIASQGYLPSVVDTNWEVAGSPDASGDARADVLWRHKVSGLNYLWIMSGLSVTSQGYMPTVADANWKVVGFGDYDGDGRGDILWRNAATGQNYLWTLNGISVASQGYLPSVSGSSWVPVK